MPTYRVEINGQNFLIDLDGHVAKRGFFTFRVIDAVDAHSAEAEAVRRIREQPDLRALVRNAADDPPVLDVENVVELDEFEEDAGLGFIWYDEHPKRWWQFWKG